jgi:hypothetical protein
VDGDCSFEDYTFPVDRSAHGGTRCHADRPHKPPNEENAVGVSRPWSSANDVARGCALAVAANDSRVMKTPIVRPVMILRSISPFRRSTEKATCIGLQALTSARCAPCCVSTSRDGTNSNSIPSPENSRLPVSRRGRRG